MYSKVNHKFNITFSIINKNNSEIKELDKCLKSVAIKKNYASNKTSLYVLNLTLSEEDRRYIVMNDVDISIHISRYTVDEINSANETGSSDSPIVDKEICNILLKPYDKEKYYSYSNSSDISDNDEKQNIEQQKVSYNLNCIPSEQISYNKTIINDCFASANLNEIIINTLSNNYTKNVYYQESKNTERFDSLLIPPMSLTQVFEYLQNNYAVYNDNINSFFDDDKLYVFDIKEKNREFNNNFLIEIKDPTDVSDKTIYQSAQVDEENNVKIYLENNPIVISSKDVFYNTVGDQTIFNSYDDNFNLVSRTYGTNETNKTRYFWNADKNKVFETKTINDFYQFISISQFNLDPTLIVPDTLINVSGSTLDEINGQYALLSNEIFYSTNDFINYSESVNISLGKLK